jgi:hypothetical protein
MSASIVAAPYWPTSPPSFVDQIHRRAMSASIVAAPLNSDRVSGAPRLERDVTGGTAVKQGNEDNHGLNNYSDTNP